MTNTIDKLPTPLLLFDGQCNLCNQTVQFVIERDPAGTISFASLQSDVGQALLKEYGLVTNDFDTILLFDNQQVYQRSSAALRVSRYLSGAWSWLSVLLVVPPFVRNAVYSWVARNRYRWFGKTEQCWLPTPDLRSRFIG